MKSSGFNIEDTHLRDIDRLIITHSIPHSFFASILAAISFVKKSKSVFLSSFSIVVLIFLVSLAGGVSVFPRRKQLETFPVFPSLKHGNTNRAEKNFENSIYNI